MLGFHNLEAQNMGYNMYGIAIVHKVGNKQGSDMQTASRTKMTIMQQPDWIDGASRFPK